MLPQAPAQLPTEIPNHALAQQALIQEPAHVPAQVPAHRTRGCIQRPSHVEPDRTEGYIQRSPHVEPEISLQVPLQEDCANPHTNHYL